MAAATTPANVASESTPSVQNWGRVLICGGTDWPKLGKKDKNATKNDDTPDLESPHLLRSLQTVRATSIHTSSTSCHTVVLDNEGTAYLFGRATPSALGLPSRPYVSEHKPHVLRTRDLDGGDDDGFAHAATGRSHTLLVGKGGQVWSAGANTLGQCGHNPCPEITSFKLVKDAPWSATDRAIKASAGVTFSLVLTESGKLYSFGSGEKGQLGHGRTGEVIIAAGKTAFDVESTPVRVKGLDGKKIVQIASGAQHSIVLDDEGFVYVFGCAGYCRLGLGNQKDMTVATIVPQFAGNSTLLRGSRIAAGLTNSSVIDNQRVYYLAGKWKTSGDGSSGQPYSTFKYLQDIQSLKVKEMALGGVTMWAIAPDDEEGGVMTIAWGQNAANCELGLGEGQAKSATKPQRVEPLRGIDVIAVAAGAHTTFILARPPVVDSDAWSDLPRHPFELDPPAPEECVVCVKDRGNDDSPLQCDKCERPYHLSCLDPPLSTVPAGEWFCTSCAKTGVVPHDVNDRSRANGGGGTDGPATQEKRGSKRKAAAGGDDDDGNKRRK